MRKSIAALAVLTIAAGLAYIAWHYLRPPSARLAAATGRQSAKSTGREPSPDETETVTALGRLEPAGGVLDIGGQAGDRVAQLHVRLGEQVDEGQQLAMLASHSLRLAELELAQEQLAEARRRAEVEQRHAAALLKEAQLAIESAELAQLDIDSQQRQISLLEANLQGARADLDRLQSLRGGGPEPNRTVVSDQQLERQQLLVMQAEAELSVARSLLEKLEKSYRLSREQADATLETARANQAKIPVASAIESLEKSVDLAKARLETTLIRAPSKGRILSIFVRAGETLAQQPILQMADTSQMMAVAEIYEDQVLDVRAGQRATITSTALPQPIEGTVTHVGTMIGKNMMVGLAPTASADLRVIEARIRLDENRYADDLINLQVTVEIRTRGPAGGEPIAVGKASGALP